MKISWVSVWPPRITPISEYSESIVAKLRGQNQINVISHIDAGRPGEAHLSPIIDLEKSDWPQTVFNSVEKYGPDLVVLNHDFSSFGYKSLATNFSQEPEDSFGFLELLFRLKNSGIKTSVFYHDLMQPLTESQKNFYNLSMQLTDSIGVFGQKNAGYISNTFNFPTRKVFNIPLITEAYSQFSKEHLRNKWNIPGGKLAYGIVGFFEAYKNLEYLIEVLERFEKRDDFVLVICGVGLPGNDESLKYEKDILAKINSSKIKNKIKLINRFLENSEINEVIQALDALVLPYSQCSQSIVLGKAVSFGIPVVASNCSNLMEALNKTKSGLIINSSNKTQSYSVFNKIFNNPNILSKLSANSLRYYKNNNIDKAIDLYNKFFKNIA